MSSGKIPTVNLAEIELRGCVHACKVRRASARRRQDTVPNGLALDP